MSEDREKILQEEQKENETKEVPSSQTEETGEATRPEAGDPADQDQTDPVDGEKSAPSADQENPQERAEDSFSTDPAEEGLKMRLLRLQADFQNYKNRVEREKKSTILYANERLLLQILDIIDNFERALASEQDRDPFFEGMEMIYRQLQEVLTRNGVEEIHSDGQAFNHELHNAVLTEESDQVESGTILETLQKGYTLHGKLVRPAMVKVAK